MGLVTVTPEYRVEVSPRIREEWFNGKAYYRLHGEQLASLPPIRGTDPGRTSSPGTTKTSTSGAAMLSESTVEALLAFRRERNWEQFHSPKNLAIALVVEASEVLQEFEWTTN